MHLNDFELQVEAQYRVEDLRRLARPFRHADRSPRVRIAMAHALIAVANQIWRDERMPAEPATGKVALT